MNRQTCEAQAEAPASAAVWVESDRQAVHRILFDPAFAELEAYPHRGTFGRTYHAAVHGDSDQSFAVFAGHAPVLVCLCAPLDGALGFYSLPLQFCMRPGIDAAIQRAAVAAAFAHLDRLAARQGLRTAAVREPARAEVSAVEQACQARGAQAERLQHACVDLTGGHTLWRAALRKSSRSLVNWGRRNLTMRFVNRETPDRTLFEHARQFHADVAGRVTRSSEFKATL